SRLASYDTPRPSERRESPEILISAVLLLQSKSSLNFCCFCCFARAASRLASPARGSLTKQSSETPPGTQIPRCASPPIRQMAQAIYFNWLDQRAYSSMGSVPSSHREPGSQAWPLPLYHRRACN